MFLMAGLLAAQDARISASRISAYTHFLAGDWMEGRGVGQRGGDLATEYLAHAMTLAGVAPAGDNGTYYQRVPLIGVETKPAARLTAAAGGKRTSFTWLEEFVGASQRQTPETRFEAEAVFVGHSITAPEFQWDDFKGVDVRGKVLILFTNEPPSDDPKFFGGKALTYYGRWTYKYEEALRRGALGCLILHTTPTAGYGWEVVRNSWGKEQPFVKLGAGEKSLALAGWLSRAAADRLLALAGRTVDELLKASDQRDFRPIPLGIEIQADLPATVRQIETRNVAGIVEGSDPELKKEVIIFTAHWDHLGIGEPVNGDRIYNGAVDNATGCGVLLEIARAWAALPQKPRRSALFLSVTAEEGGLRGSEWYGAHPLFPLAKTALALNYDALFPLGRAKDVVVTGAERTTAWPIVEQVARRMNLELAPDARPEQGSYFRSDHFSLAKAGVPAFTIGHGSEFAGKPAGFALKLFEEFNAKHYHQPSDEFHDDWDFTALEQAAEFGMGIGIAVANQ
jgi:Zn-dependent M28 family amino/carboxypeptidase